MTLGELIKQLEDMRLLYGGKALQILLDCADKTLEQTDKIEESNFSTEQYKADLQGAYDCGYNSGYADAMNDIAESEDKE